MAKMTGFQRMTFVKEWIKRGKPPTKEDFIRKCCETYGLEYIAPPDIKAIRESKIVEIVVRKDK